MEFTICEFLGIYNPDDVSMNPRITKLQLILETRIIIFYLITVKRY